VRGGKEDNSSPLIHVKWLVEPGARLRSRTSSLSLALNCRDYIIETLSSFGGGPPTVSTLLTQFAQSG
jgi:hypothetical protein